MQKVRALAIVSLLVIVLFLGCTGPPAGNESSQNQPPVATFTIVTPSEQPELPIMYYFSAFASNDTDGSIVLYAWSFGDGSTGSGIDPSHTYSAAGTYTITLTVTDDKGATGVDTETLTITPPGVVTGLKEHTFIVWQENSSPNNFDLYFYDLETRQKRPIVVHPANQISVSANENKVVWGDYRNDFSSYFKGRASVMMYDLKTGETKDLSGYASYDQRLPLVYGDMVIWFDVKGENFLYGSLTGAKPYPQLFFISNSTKIPINQGNNPTIVTSLNSSHLLMSVYEFDGWNVYLYDIKTGEKTRIKRINYSFRALEDLGVYPVMAGKKVVLDDEENTLWSIYIYDTETKAFEKITDPVALLEFPHTDGERVVWQATSDYYFIDINNQPYTTYNTQIYLYDTGTKEKRLLTPMKRDHPYVYAVQPRVSGDKVVWFQKINPELNFSDLGWTQEINWGTYQVFLYDITKNETIQLTNDTRDHVLPTITRYYD